LISVHFVQAKKCGDARGPAAWRTLPLEQRAAEFESRSIAQRGQAGTPNASDVSGVAPKRMSPDEKTRLMNFTDLLLPGVGILPYGRLADAARPLFTRPPVDPLREFTANVSDDQHRIRQAGTADRAEITRDSAGMPREQRTGEIQRALCTTGSSGKISTQ
jgi:hypothetical protein